MRQFINLMEDSFVSKSSVGSGFVGMDYSTLWESVAEDRIPGEINMVKTLEEALKAGPVAMEFDRSKLLAESLSLQPALVRIHANFPALNEFIGEREMDAIFLTEEDKKQVEMIAWFLRTSPMMKGL